jgi:hypothetical protein
MGLTVQPPSTLASFDGTIVISGADSAKDIASDIRAHGFENEVMFLMPEKRDLPDSIP